MMATIGYIAPFYGTLPGDLSPSKGIHFADIPMGVQAATKIPSGGLLQIFLSAALIEFGLGGDRGIEEWKSGPAGDYGKGFLGMFGPVMDPEKKQRSLNAEIANGRLAMVAITGMVLQEGVAGGTGIEMWVPPAAFESELGVQDPVGFWDPAGFTADGSTENFARRRQTELKHGRVSMLATMGYITPEITGKLPGYLSPSAGLKFADVPNGLGAISKVPAAGWAQIVAYGAFCELSQDQSAGTAAAAGDFGFKVLTSSDAAEKQKKLAAEIANGRLAMMAIIGMFFQDGLTGSRVGRLGALHGLPLARL
ncbi:unnamed protein product [Prorocentrum cordatum]|uniref:Uncharacterized protein n=1 Tax=Prorocentrum cordatum TaxID=2364126 RepID=A0ABN9W8V1_9DINO|nr:unnamed protein product [Polarella glacialis]